MTKRYVSYPEAKELGDILHKNLCRISKRVKMAGSLRRECSEIGDLNYVCIPRDSIGEFHADLERILPGCMGSYYIQGWFQTMPVSVLVTDDYNWGASLLWLTGSKRFVNNLMMRAKKNGFIISMDGIRGPMGPLSAPTEKVVFALLEMRYVTVRERI